MATAPIISVERTLNLAREIVRAQRSQNPSFDESINDVNAAAAAALAEAAEAFIAVNDSDNTSALYRALPEFLTALSAFGALSGLA